MHTEKSHKHDILNDICELEKCVINCNHIDNNIIILIIVHYKTLTSNNYKLIIIKHYAILNILFGQYYFIFLSNIVAQIFF